MRYEAFTVAYGTREEIIAEIKDSYTPGRSERRKSQLIRALIEIEDEGARTAFLGEHFMYVVEGSPTEDFQEQVRKARERPEFREMAEDLPTPEQVRRMRENRDVDMTDE